MRAAAPTPLPRYFYSLDALRGVAALVVVLFHWRHFFFQGTRLALVDDRALPLYRWLWPLYQAGDRAVELFFCLSGFLFFWLYQRSLQAGKVSPWEFALLRFSRLYPLHFLTLVVVGAGQWLFFRRYGVFFVYPYNDMPHFLGHLTLTLDWGFLSRNSFNGPAWSVSIEVALYILFVLVCVRDLTRWWHLVLFMLGGALFTVVPVNQDLARGVAAFFAGGLAFYAVERLHQKGYGGAVPLQAGLALVVLWGLFALTEQEEWPVKGLRYALGSPDLVVMGKPRGPLVSFLVSFLACNLLLFPLTIATLALSEPWWRAAGKRLAFLGHISYSSYLWHFPLQLGFVLLGGKFAPGGTAYRSAVTLATFYAALIALSLGSYWYIEMPIQSWVRRKALNPSKVRVS